MVITYHGGECFKVAFGDTTLAFNPISSNSKLKSVRFGADVALVTAEHPDFNGIAQTAHGGSAPFAITGPGEYEVAGVDVRGVPSATGYDGCTLNTIYLVTLENIRLCFLGALKHTQLSSQAQEAITDVDILFVPIGGDGVLDPSGARELAAELGPHIVIPMHYPSDAGAMGNKDTLNTFLKETGAEGKKAEEKLTVKRRDLEGKEGEVAVLKG